MDYSREELVAGVEMARREGNESMAAALQADLDAMPTAATRGFGTALGQGATFGFMDELRAGAGSLMDQIGGAVGDFDPERAKGYGEYAAGERQAYDKYKQDSPVSAFAGEALGGLVTGGLGAARVGATTAGRNFAARVGQQQGARRIGSIAGVGAASGAAGGALGGAGNANSLAEVPGAAAFGGALGGIGGGILGGAGAGVGEAIRAARHALNPDAIAAKRVLGALDEQGMSTDDAMGALQSKPGAVIADLGEGTRNELEAVAQAPGATAGRVQDELGARSVAQADELEGAIGGAGQRQKLLGDLEAERRATAPQMYADAYAAPTPMTDSLEALWKRPTIQNFWNSNQMKQSAQEIADVEGLPHNPKMFDEESPSTMGWDYLIRGLDDEIGRAARNDSKGRVRRLTHLRTEISNEVSKANPKLQEARKYWAGGEQFKEAMEDGRAIFRTSADDLGSMLGRMSSADKASFREGVKQAVTDKMDGGGDLHDMTKHFNTRGMRKRMREVFDSDEEFDSFYDRVQQLTEQQATFNRARGGSRTARTQSRQADIASMGRDAMFDMATGSGWMQTLARIARSANPADRQSVRDRIGDILLAQGPAAQRQELQGLLAQAQRPIAAAQPQGLVPLAAMSPAITERLR